MACAAILSLEEFRDTHRQVESRQRLHDRVDQWLHQLEVHVNEPQPTLEQLTQAVCALRQALTPAVTAGVVEQAHRAAMAQRPAAGPQCGQMWSARGPQDRTVETRVGALRLRRPYLYGARCQRGTTPLDAVLRLTERRQQPEVQKAAVQVTPERPEETACERFAELTGLPRSAHAAHEVPPAVATGLTGLAVAPSRAEMVAKSAAVATGQPWRPIVVWASEGAEVPTRPETAQGRRPGRQRARAKRAQGTGEWREANGFRFDRRADDRIVQGLSWHPIHTAAEAAEALRQVKAAGVIPEEQIRRCVVADGARWIWTQAHALCPSAGEMLDDDPWSEPRHQGAVLQDGAPPERPQPWDEAALARLLYGEGHGVIWGLQRMKPTDAQAAEAIGTRVRSLQRHQARLAYRCARKGGDPMGSGGSESATTCIGPVRLQRSGAWW